MRVTVGPELTRVESRAWPEARQEPDRWTSHLERRDPGRPLGGAVGVALGGRETGQGRQEWDELRVRDESGDASVGEVVVPFDGRDSAGRDLASGTYLYRVTAGGVLYKGRMSLVR